MMRVLGYLLLPGLALGGHCSRVSLERNMGPRVAERIESGVSVLVLYLEKRSDARALHSSATRSSSRLYFLAQKPTHEREALSLRASPCVQRTPSHGLALNLTKESRRCCICICRRPSPSICQNAGNFAPDRRLPTAPAPWPLADAQSRLHRPHPPPRRRPMAAPAVACSSHARRAA